VKVPIYVSPKHVYLRGQKNKQVSKAVTIRAGKEQPLKLEPNAYDLTEKVLFKIQEIQEGKLFRIYFTNVPSSEEFYRGTLKLKTNYTEKPELLIHINARFNEPPSN
jgi:hypothetical protein